MNVGSCFYCLVSTGFASYIFGSFRDSLFIPYFIFTKKKNCLNVCTILDGRDLLVFLFVGSYVYIFTWTLFLKKTRLLFTIWMDNKLDGPITIISHIVTHTIFLTKLDRTHYTLFGSRLTYNM